MILPNEERHDMYRLPLLG